MHQNQHANHAWQLRCSDMALRVEGHGDDYAARSGDQGDSS
jgi:hypothetical protein